MQALVAGIELAKSLGVDLYTVTVEEQLPRYAATMEEVDAVKEQKDAYFEEMNRGAEVIASRESVTLHTAVIAGHEVHALIDYVVKGKFDALLVGFHGHSAISDRIFGSTSRSLVLNAPCTVIVVK